MMNWFVAFGIQHSAFSIQHSDFNLSELSVWF